MYMYVCTNVYMHICIYVYICIPVMHICAYVLMHTSQALQAGIVRRGRVPRLKRRIAESFAPMVTKAPSPPNCWDPVLHPLKRFRAPLKGVGVDIRQV